MSQNVGGQFLRILHHFILQKIAQYCRNIITFFHEAFKLFYFMGMCWFYQTKKFYLTCIFHDIYIIVNYVDIEISSVCQMHWISEQLSFHQIYLV